MLGLETFDSKKFEQDFMVSHTMTKKLRCCYLFQIPCSCSHVPTTNPLPVVILCIRFEEHRKMILYIYLQLAIYILSV